MGRGQPDLKVLTGARDVKVSQHDQLCYHEVSAGCCVWTYTLPLSTLTNSDETHLFTCVSELKEIVTIC